MEIEKNKEPYYKIDYDSLMKEIKGEPYQIIFGMISAIRSIFYLLEAAGFQINEDLYDKLDDDGKEFFKKV